MIRKRKIRVDELPEFVLENFLQDDPLALAVFITDCLSDPAHCEQLIGDPLHQLLLAKQSPTAEAMAVALKEEMAAGEGLSFALVSQVLRELGLRLELVPHNYGEGGAGSTAHGACRTTVRNLKPRG